MKEKNRSRIQRSGYSPTMIRLIKEELKYIYRIPTAITDIDKAILSPESKQ
jgi:hypothetical protein